MNPEKRTMLPKVAFTGFAARYREPKAEEGFQDITKVHFKVSRRRSACVCVKIQTAYGLRQFEGTEEQKAQWKKYWIT